MPLVSTLKAEVRRWTNSNGSEHYVRQCLICGARSGESISQNKISHPVEDADRTLAARYHEERDTARKDIDQKHIRIQRAEGNRYQKEYELYRRSDTRRAKREKVLRRAKGICEGCHDADATQIHHLTYDHRGDELLFELVALCEACHRKCHPDKNHVSLIEKDMDGFPCLACRYQASNENDRYWCSQFNVLSEVALSKTGGCGPNASALEPLK